MTVPALLDGARHQELALPALIRRELRSIQPDKLPPLWPDDARYREDLHLDSLDLVEMVARLEQATGLFVPDADLPRLVSVAATAEYIEARRASAALSAA